jgi:hypothetical protein
LLGTALLAGRLLPLWRLLLGPLLRLVLLGRLGRILVVEEVVQVGQQSIYLPSRFQGFRPLLVREPPHMVGKVCLHALQIRSHILKVLPWKRLNLGKMLEGATHPRELVPHLVDVYNRLLLLPSPLRRLCHSIT